MVFRVLAKRQWMQLFLHLLQPIDSAPGNAKGLAKNSRWLFSKSGFSLA